MATADLIQEFNDDLLGAYSAIEAKGGTAPEAKNSHNLTSAINSIPTGGGTIPYFDGGEYGAIAYLAGGELKYHWLTADEELTGVTYTSGSHGTFITVDGVAVNQNNLVAFSYGSVRKTPSLAGNYYFSSCYVLQAIYGLELAGGNSVGDYFLLHCNNFNSPITFSNNVRSIGNSFMGHCYRFNSPIKLSNTLTSIGPSFIYNCYSFNSPITFNEGRDESLAFTIGGGFMAQCMNFNQPVDPFFKYVTNFTESTASSQYGFFPSCRSFNQPITFNPKITFIPHYFLASCHSFNFPIALPEGLTAIHVGFLSGATAFAQPLTLPDTVTTVGNYFMQNANRFTGPLNVGKASGYYMSNSMLSTTNADAPMYTTGVTLTGANAQAVKDGWPDRDTSPYRKLIVA